MKIAESNGAQIHLLQADHTLLVIERDAIFFRCTTCGEIKSVHMLTNDEKLLPWMRQCTCSTNAPSTGGDTQPLVEPVQVPGQHPYHPLSDAPNIVYANATTYRARLVERDEL